MDAFDFAPDPDEKPKRSCSDVIFRLAGYYFIAGILFLIGYFVLIYFNPQSSLNPFRPAQQAAQGPPTETAAPIPTDTLAPSETTIPSATDTSGAAFTATLELPTSTPNMTNTIEVFPTATDVILVTNTPAPTVSVVRHFSVQDTPLYLPYSGGCDGLYVAGNVTDLNGQPLAFMIVKLTGTLNGEAVSGEDLSGGNTDYSESGWEIKISDTLLNSTQTLSVALYEQGGVDPISDVIIFDTFNSCSQNLVIINFVQDQ